MTKAPPLHGLTFQTGVLGAQPSPELLSGSITATLPAPSSQGQGRREEPLAVSPWPAAVGDKTPSCERLRTTQDTQGTVLPVFPVPQQPVPPAGRGAALSLDTAGSTDRKACTAPPHPMLRRREPPPLRAPPPRWSDPQRRRGPAPCTGGHHRWAGRGGHPEGWPELRTPSKGRPRGAPQGSAQVLVQRASEFPRTVSGSKSKIISRGPADLGTPHLSAR